jgi:multicomponent Na+:H+ antiporter subunit E
MIGHVILRLTLWFLLTANFSVANIMIGVAIALLLPRGANSRERLGELFVGVWRIIKAVPQAYVEAIEMMFKPHDREEIVLDPVPPGRSHGMVFLDIFYITFTPKTIVLKYRDDRTYGDCTYEVHRVDRGQRS